MRWLSVLLCLLFLSSCSHIKTREQIEKEKQTPQQTEGTKPGQADKDPEDGEVKEEPPQQLGELPEDLKAPDLNIGIVLGPSALKAPAQIGVLQELMQTKLKIQAVAGMEMGALVGALFAQSGQSNDAEWKYFKLKEDELIERSFLGGELQPQAISKLQPFLNENFGQSKMEKSEFEFLCPSLEVKTGRTKWLTRGEYAEILPYCMAYPPLYQPFRGHVADTLSYEEAAANLRKAGANYIILIDVIGAEVVEKSQLPTWPSVIWAMTKAQALDKQKGFDFVIRVDTQKYDMLGYSSRRELLKQGRSQGRKSAQKLVEIHGL